jgi:hypothetical protein
MRPLQQGNRETPTALAVCSVCPRVSGPKKTQIEDAALKVAQSSEEQVRDRALLWMQSSRLTAWLGSPIGREAVLS